MVLAPSTGQGQFSRGELLIDPSRSYEDTLRGIDPRARFNEPDAPEQASEAVNAVTLIYKIMPGYAEKVEPLPADVPADCWWAAYFPAMSCLQYPDGGLTRCALAVLLDTSTVVQILFSP